MRLLNFAIVISLLAPITAFAEPTETTGDVTDDFAEGKATCEHIWAEEGIEHFRLAAARILEIHWQEVDLARRQISERHPNHITIDHYVVYDGMHRVIWEELARRNITGLPSPRVRKDLIRMAQLRVVRVWSRPS